MTASVMSQIARGWQGNAVPQTPAGDIQDIAPLTPLYEHAMFSLEAAELEAGFSECQRIQASFESIVRMSSEFFTAGEAATEAQANLYRLSVESVLRAAGLDYHINLVAPSFEASKDYSAEAEEKSGSVFSRVMTWLSGLLNKLVEAVKNFIGRFRKAGAASEARHTEMKAEADKVFAAEKKASAAAAAPKPAPTAAKPAAGATPAKPAEKAPEPAKKEEKPSEPKAKPGFVTVSDPNFMVDGSGSFSDPKVIIQQCDDLCRATGADVMAMCRTVAATANGITLDSVKTPEDAQKFIQHILSNVGLQAAAKREFKAGPNSLIVMTREGEDKVKVASSVVTPAKSKEAPLLSEKDLYALLDVMTKLDKKLDSIAAPMVDASQAIESLAKKMSQLADQAASKEGDAKNASDVFKTLGAVLRSLMQIPTAVMTTNAKTHWSMDQYIHRCLKAHRGQ